MSLHSIRDVPLTSDPFTLVVDVVADLAALIIPLRLLVVLQDRWLRTRLMAIFSTCIITTAVSIVHGILILKSKSPAVVVVALAQVSLSALSLFGIELNVVPRLQSSVSLIVCNLPVMATSLLNLSEHSGGPRLPPSNENDVSTTNSARQISIHFLSLNNVPSSQTSASVLLTEAPVAIRHEPRIIQGVRSARPSSVLLKPDSDHPPRI